MTSRPTRNRSLERACLKPARSPEFATHALDRLASGEILYGSRWTELGVSRLLDEILEEAADIGAWGVLALQALDVEVACPVTRMTVAELIEVAIAAGALAHRALTSAAIACSSSERSEPVSISDDRAIHKPDDGDSPLSATPSAIAGCRPPGSA